MGRNVFLRLMLIVIAGGCSMLGDAVERGVRYVRNAVVSGSPAQGLSYALALRTLALHDGNGGWLPPPSDSLPEEDMDLVRAATSWWTERSGLQGWESLISADGGWTAEAGGRSEVAATIMGLSLLVDAPVPWLEELVRQGLGYLLRTCCAEGQLEPGKQLGTASMQLEWFVLLCQMFRESLLQNRQQERQLHDLKDQLAREFAQLTPDSSCYQAGRFLRGASMLGKAREQKALVRWLLDCQLPEGGWGVTPRHRKADLLATCAALEGLMAAEVTPQPLDSFLQCFKVARQGQPQPVEQLRDGTHLRVTLPQVSGRVRLTVYDQTGRIRESRTLPTGQDTLWLDYRDWPPGTYELALRCWKREGLGWAGEQLHRLQVPLWGDVLRVRVLERKGHQRLGMGTETELTPVAVIDWAGNGRLEGTVSCVLEDGEGKVLRKFGTESMVTDAGGGQLEVVFPSQTCTLTQAGNVVLVATASMGTSRKVGRHLIFVEGAYALEVSNRLLPAALPVGSQPGQVLFQIVSHGEGKSGVPAAMGYTTPRELEISPEGAGIAVSGIVDEQGRQVDRGWVVIRADFGGCTGGIAMNGTGRTGSLTAHGVENGVCHFGYVPGKLLEDSVTALSVYGAYEHGGTIQRLNTIGHIELRLRKTDF